MRSVSRRSSRASRPDAPEVPDAYWALSVEELGHELGSTASGLSQREASARLKRYGRNALDTKRRATALGLLLNQFKSPLVLILIVATIISLVAAEWNDAGVVLAIVLGSAILGFLQEYVAGNAIDKLRSKVTIPRASCAAGSCRPWRRPGSCRATCCCCRPAA